ncbi:MAG: BACON domain-containing protein, partial [Clostridia bacterium]|nr:BACON domain-containing protein [Clostridia bacterium]
MKRLTDILLMAAVAVLCLAACNKTEKDNALPKFELSTTGIAFAGDGETRTVTVKTDATDWVVSADADWLGFS